MKVTALHAPEDFVASARQAAQRLDTERIYDRILARDHTVWRPEPDEIANRLGWLDSPQVMRAQLDSIRAVVDAARQEGYTHALLLGMGGSSLAPEVLRAVFGVADGFLDLAVLDSTHPDAVLATARALDPARTLFIPATKSGGTVETLSLLKYFYNFCTDAIGRDAAGSHFAAITDPGSGLEALAARLGFRHIFRNDPNIGGRYSALSFYGLVAAGAVGIDLNRLLDRAQAALDDPQPGLQLGAFLGAGSERGRDKLTLIASPGLQAAGAWIEQLIAESTGKGGTGLLPVDLEPAATAYGDDRLFVYLRLDDALDDRVASLAAAGHPVLQLDHSDAYDLGGTFLHWEIATAIAGFFLAIHPFDQPNVEAAKVLARDMVATYQQQGSLPAAEPALVEGDLALYGDPGADTLQEALAAFLAAGRKGQSYIALQAYVHATPDVAQHLAALRGALLARTGLATTLGIGPRFLHSTGQLHKGDGGHGLFLQLTAGARADAPIPDEAGAPSSGMGFGVLIQAQASGDRQALSDAGRKVLRIHLGSDTGRGLEQLLQALN